MCLHLEESDEKIYIAETDIRVYKILRNYGTLSPKWMSPFRLSIYQPMQFLLIDNLTIVYDDVVPVIEEGFHAFRSLDTALLYVSSRIRAFEMIIPKGSQYANGLRDEIVSNCLLTGAMFPISERTDARVESW